MYYPRVTIALDKEYDKESILEFIDDKDEFLDFGYERIIQWHPELESYRGKAEKEQKMFISDYVDRYYAEHNGELELSVNKLQNIWDEVAEKYFIELEKLFGRLDFYVAKEIKASPSITLCGDISDDHATFHIWYKWHDKPEDARVLIAHEILHFYYYAYVREREFSTLIDQWDLAEIFNVVILGLPQFIAFTGKPDLGYEQHDKYFPYYRELWKKSGCLDEYLHKTNEQGLGSRNT